MTQIGDYMGTLIGQGHCKPTMFRTISSAARRRENAANVANDGVSSPESDYELVPRRWISSIHTPSSSDNEYYEPFRLWSLPATPSTNKSFHNNRSELSNMQAEILDLKLQLINTKAARDTAIKEMEIAQAALETSQTEIISLKRELEKKAPLFQVGVAIRLGFIDAANRVRIRGRTQIISPDLFVDRNVAQAKIEAYHRGNLLADASLFDPELKIPDVKNYIQTFNHLYDPDAGRVSRPKQIQASQCDDLESEEVSIDAPDSKSRPHNVHDIDEFQKCKDSIISHPNLLEIYNLRASMISCHAWTKFSHDKKADERYSKLEKRAISLVQEWDHECVSKEEEDVSAICGAKMKFEFEVILTGMRVALKETVKKQVQAHRGPKRG
ncbi:hypothetical protein EG329_011753 [Mollisiaceae sp. DMI_Dod_QoI]|nr:hypothetical protein EG329_011753 [Helotiales sp. DMI_Dod_QoI]